MSRFTQATHLSTAALLLAALLVLPTGARAALTSDAVPEVKRTPQALYLTAEEAFALRTSQPGNTVLVDIRTVEEALYVGVPGLADALIPYKFLDTTTWDRWRKGFAMRHNEAFEAQLVALLESRGLGYDANIVLLCRSGKRSARAAAFLNDLEYTNVYTVVDGFEGDTEKNGPEKGKRVVNGWKNAGLPWSYTADKAQLLNGN